MERSEIEGIFALRFVVCGCARGVCVGVSILSHERSTGRGRHWRFACGFAILSHWWGPEVHEVTNYLIYLVESFVNGLKEKNVSFRISHKKAVVWQRQSSVTDVFCVCCLLSFVRTCWKSHVTGCRRTRHTSQRCPPVVSAPNQRFAESGGYGMLPMMINACKC